ncbi:MAG: HAMP domain-containing sensor histidine kinase [Candidatus Bathyarchaeota archaeon]|nr:HAMP domain-containing sensor histidine kinase [Candidatus Bathyarchaeota archaeon]
MREAEPKSIEELRRALAESERRYEELQASVDERAKAEFQAEMTRVSSELAHDLRGPLQIITNSLFLMERKPGDTTYYPKISEALKQATGLLDGFREYYRGHEITLMKGNVNRLIEKSFEDITVPTGVTVSKSLDPGIPDIMLDIGKIRRVFTIVLKNAVEAMPNGGMLHVSTRIDGDGVVVKVGDTGTGIPEQIRDKIFIAFGAKKRGGYGLGLAAAKRTVEAHGGAISFETETGKGTTFTVSLPIR